MHTVAYIGLTKTDLDASYREQKLTSIAIFTYKDYLGHIAGTYSLNGADKVPVEFSQAEVSKHFID